MSVDTLTNPLFGIRLQFVGQNYNPGVWKPYLEPKTFHSEDEANSEGLRIVKLFPFTLSAYRIEPTPNL